MNNDVNTPISYFKEKVQEFIEARNWSKYHTPKNLIQAIGIEVAELSELFLFKAIKIEDILCNEKFLENISDEVADVFIYLISLVNCLKLDITKAFIKKMKKNNIKYSIEEFKNGDYRKKNK
ncbi:MAG: nucleotide pyrophosphohydrolase [Promethearchaeota archaeon]